MHRRLWRCASWAWVPLRHTHTHVSICVFEYNRQAVVEMRKLGLDALETHTHTRQHMCVRIQSAGCCGDAQAGLGCPPPPWATAFACGSKRHGNGRARLIGVHPTPVFYQTALAWLGALDWRASHTCVLTNGIGMVGRA